MKLKVSEDVKFEVRFSLNDAGSQVEFGFKMEAKRADKSPAGETVGEMLSKRAKVRMTAWIEGLPVPIQDDAGIDVPAGPAALEALYDLLPNMPGLVLGAYLEATGAKAKSGN